MSFFLFLPPRLPSTEVPVRARKNWHGLTRRVILISVPRNTLGMVRDDTKCALFIFVMLGNEVPKQERREEGGFKEEGGRSSFLVFPLDTKFIYSRGTRALLRGATIEIGIASGRNKNSLPSASLVFSRTRRFFSVSRQKHNRQNWDTQVRIRKYTGRRRRVFRTVRITIRAHAGSASGKRAGITMRERFCRLCKLLCVKFLRNGINRVASPGTRRRRQKKLQNFGKLNSTVLSELG